MKNKIYLCLLGGLGNQLFQYAYARNLQIKYNFDLFLDHKTGFILDFRDRRKFELKRILDIANLRFIPFFIIFKIYKKIFGLKKKIIYFGNKTIFDEANSNTFEKKFLKKIKGNEIYLHGFFQSEKYFLNNKKKIIKELMPKRPKEKLFTNFISDLKNKSGVALCIRLFNEVNSNDIKKIGGRLNVSYYNAKIKFFRKKIKNPHFYIFSDNESNDFYKYIKKLKINKRNYTLITPKKGFRDPYNTLWILSHFKYQVIANSTFHWWGAYFAKERLGKVHIQYPNNFSNKDTVTNVF